MEINIFSVETYFHRDKQTQYYTVLRGGGAGGGVSQLYTEMKEESAKLDYLYQELCF